MRAVGFAAIGAMVAVPFVGAWVDQQREGRRQRRNGRIVERAHREDRVAR